MKSRSLIFLSFLFCCSSVFSLDFKMRAREHYEINKVKSGLFSSTFKGLSNTVNIWWEKPYKYSFGFALSPVLSGLSSSEASPLGEEIKIYHFGLEGKYFPRLLINKLYLRSGLTYSMLKPDLLEDTLKGYGLYLGIGYEIPFKMFGLAIEMGTRYTKLDKGYEVNSTIGSLGFHFYKSL